MSSQEPYGQPSIETEDLSIEVRPPSADASALPVREVGMSADTAEESEVLISIDVPETGDTELDEMLRSLAESAALSPAEQLPMIEAVHRSLQDRLADTEG